MKTMLAEFSNRLAQAAQPSRWQPNAGSQRAFPYKLFHPGCIGRSLQRFGPFGGLTLVAFLLTAMLQPVHQAQAQPSCAAPLTFECGMSVATCFSSSGPNFPSSGTCPGNTAVSDPNGFVLALMDTRNTPALPGYWATTMFHNEFPVTVNTWNQSQLGEIFGIALDGATPANIYVTATSLYAGDTPGPLGFGGVYKISGSTFAICDFIALPGVGRVSLGNICYDKAHNQLFISVLDDGTIRRVSAAACPAPGQLSSYDHGVQGRPNAGLSPISDTSALHFLTDVPRRVFGLQVRNGRLYYAVTASITTSTRNEIWSVGLLANGDFDLAAGAAGPRQEITGTVLQSVPHLTASTWTPVTDIAFSQGGKMLLAERVVCTDSPDNLNGYAHRARVLEFSGPIWTPTVPYAIGSINNGRNSAGGVDYGCDDTIYATADAIQFPSPQIYGVQVLKPGVTTLAQSSWIDLDCQTTSTDKTLIGDVEVYRCCTGCLCITNKLVECISTNSTYKWEFCITNCWNMGIKYLSFLDLPPGLTINRDIVTLPSVLLPGQGVCLTLYLTNAPGLTNVCFTVGAHTTNFFECCSVTNCLTFAPCCVYLSGEKLTPIFMSPPMANCYNYTFTVKNVTWPPMPIKYMFMVQDPAPPPNCITFTPDVITFNPPLQPNQSMTKSVKVCLNPSSLCKAPYYFLASAHNSNLVECCSTRYCLPKASWCHPIDFPHGVDGSVVQVGSTIRVPVTIDRTFVQPRRAIGYDGTNAVASIVDPTDGQHDDWFVISNAVAGPHILRAELIDTLGGVWSTEETTVYVVEAFSPDPPAPAPVLLVPAGALTVGQVRFLLQTELGVTCHVEYTESLSPANWQVFQTIVGDGTTVTVTDAATNAPQRFYRVRVE